MNKKKQIMIQLFFSFIVSTLGVIAVHYKLLPKNNFTGRHSSYKSFDEAITDWTIVFILTFVAPLVFNRKHLKDSQD